jgi:hypothetical protein
LSNISLGTGWKTLLHKGAQEKADGSASRPYLDKGAEEREKTRAAGPGR